MSVRGSVYLRSYISDCQLVFLPLYLYVYPSICVSVFYVCLSVCTSICLSVYLSMYLFVRLCLSLCVSRYPFVCFLSALSCRNQSLPFHHWNFYPSDRLHAKTLDAKFRSGSSMWASVEAEGLFLRNLLTLWNTIDWIQIFPQQQTTSSTWYHLIIQDWKDSLKTPSRPSTSNGTSINVMCYRISGAGCVARQRT